MSSYTETILTRQVQTNRLFEMLSKTNILKSYPKLSIIKKGMVKKKKYS
uniref:Uncharacterized protein n=1 Tax=Anguilla anguilla TaxID=7936 RepID=A0A0E9WN42_ANGAN